MSENFNKSYRIKTTVKNGSLKNDLTNTLKDEVPLKDEFNFVNIDTQILQDYDTFDILSLNISQEDTYRLHNSNYGIIVGRVIANNGFGVPNAKVSIFVEADMNDNDEMSDVYDYQTTASRNSGGIRYNLLPDNKVDTCHQVVGTFPNKRYLLENDILMEVFDKYYTLTTRTNDSGDFMLCGVPSGFNTLHVDLDLSDCGILSQRPRDMIYKGYDINEFESPNKFKTGTTLDSLKQIVTQDQVVYVYPFWGNENNGDNIGITRADINISYKFEPTCIFIGSIIGDNQSNGFSKKCVPTPEMGLMEEMMTGEGRIEMIRKTIDNNIESYSIKGNLLIDANGTWCYQIPMNLDYIMTDEYGNIVPTDDPERGIPTRTSVRFRMSMTDFEGSSDRYLRGKILVPHNPQNIEVSGNIDEYSIIKEHEEYDYSFGSDTRDESFRDLLWNNVYTVKQYIPRIQRFKTNITKRVTGIKGCNFFGNNNPMPYNNIRIRLPFMFMVLCALIKAYVRIVTVINFVNWWLTEITRRISMRLLPKAITSALGGFALESRLITIADGLCPDLENWHFAPTKKGNLHDRVFRDKPHGEDSGPIDGGDDGDLYLDALIVNSTGDTTGEKVTIKINDEDGDSKYDFACFTKTSNKGNNVGYPIVFNPVLYDWLNVFKPNENTFINGNGQYIKIDSENYDNKYLYITYEEINNKLNFTERDNFKEVVSKTFTINVNGEEFDVKGWKFNETRRTKLTGGTWWNYAVTELHNQNDNDEPYTAYVDLFKQTLYYLSKKEGDAYDSKSIDTINANQEDKEKRCLTTNTDYLIQCIEMNLAQEYRVINFDFYNDWVNGVLYFPRWMMDYRPKRKYLFGSVTIEAKTKGCLTDENDGSSIFHNTRYYGQKCSLSYGFKDGQNDKIPTKLKTKIGCTDIGQNCDKVAGFTNVPIFGKNGGIIKQKKTMLGEDVYYYKPCEWIEYANNKISKVNLYATDIVLLGSLNECSLYGIPQAFKMLEASTYKMPTNLALTNMDSDSYMYGVNNGSESATSMCNLSSPESASAQTLSGWTASGVSINALTFESEQAFASDSEYSDLFISNVPDDENISEYGDFMAITEAAGIAWNYSGPGQGENVFSGDTIYQPGGHFLGLSCVYSEINVKSCINLKRICELGAEMSQRREWTKGFVRVGSDIVDVGNYFIPTGLISNSDIVGRSVRSMFATMNMNRLIASEEDEQTGHYKYKFTYLDPNGFNGELNDKLYTDSWKKYYNNSVSGLSLNEKTFIESNGQKSSQYDMTELIRRNTFAKTEEILNEYYYRFRLGLKDSYTQEDVKTKYLKVQDGGYVMPQYENSFYFYFGLRGGATAFDRFQHEFFAECSSDYIASIDSPNVVFTDIGDNNVRVIVYNMTPRFIIKYIQNDIVTITHSDSMMFDLYNVKINSRIVISDINGMLLDTVINFN